MSKCQVTEVVYTHLALAQWTLHTLQVHVESTQAGPKGQGLHTITQLFAVCTLLYCVTVDYFAIRYSIKAGMVYQGLQCIVNHTMFKAPHGNSVQAEATSTNPGQLSENRAFKPTLVNSLRIGR